MPERAEQLAAAHRQHQAKLGALVVAEMLLLWSLVDLENLFGTIDRWQATVAAYIASRRVTSARIAADFIVAHRRVELAADEPPHPPALAFVVPSDLLLTSMLVTGPIVVARALRRGMPLVEAGELGQAASAAAAMRHVLNGGRDTVIDTVQTDPRALGYARRTSGHPCAFCAMLASRGPVYKTSRSALLRSSDGHRYHDSCHCAADPVYRADAPWPAGSRELHDLWNATTAGQHGNDALNAFRRALAHR